MASSKKSKKDIADEISLQRQKLAELDKEWLALQKISKEWDRLAQKKQSGKKYDEERLKALEDEYGNIDKLDKKVNSLGDRYNKLSNSVGEFNKGLKRSIEDFDDLDSSLTSFANGIGKLPGVYDKLEDKIKTTKDTLRGISDILQDQNTLLSDEQIVAVQSAANAYKGMTSEIANAQKQLQKGNTTQEEYNSLVKAAYENFEELTDKIDASTEAGKQLQEIFAKAKREAEDFTSAASQSQKKLDTINTAMDQLGSSGIPLMNELSSVVKNKVNGNLQGTKIALTALGAAMGALAVNYFGASMQVNIEMANKRIQSQIDLLNQLGKNEVEFDPGVISKKAAIQAGEIDIDYKKKELENTVDIGAVEQRLTNEVAKSKIQNQDEINKLNVDAQFAAERAANAFSASMKSAAAEFRAASKTALFGNKLGGVGYGSAQLQMAGISADKIAGAMSAASAATGKMPTGKMGADMSIMAERTGTSVDNIAQLNEYFQRTDKVSAEVAMNMQEGMRAMADNAGISLGNLMQEVAEASKDALSYQIKSGPALAKQVAYAQSLGVGFGDIAKAGKSMVLNYKDSIKAEMQLSSLLGEQVDLSEVRAKFAEGDTEGALKALQSQGLDPKDMDMFQQEALSQALGGMDLQSLSKIATNQGAQVGNLQQGKAGAANQDFLKRSVAAQQQLSAEQAQISAQQAIIDSKTSQKALEAYLNSPETIANRKAALEQELAEAKVEAEIQKKKVATMMDPALVGMQKKNADLEAELAHLIATMETYNKKILDAAAQQKQLDIRKTITENALPAVGGLVGGMIMNGIGNKLGGGKFFGGGGGGKSFADKRKMVTGGKKGGFFKGGGLKKALIGTAIAGVAAWGISKLAGKSKEEEAPAPAAEPTVTPGEQPAAGTAFASNDICSCIGQVVSQIQGSNDLLREQIITTEDWNKETAGYMQAQTMGAISDTVTTKLTTAIEKKVGTGLEKMGAKVLGKKAGVAAAETGGKTIAQKVGLTAVKKGGTEIIEKVAQTSMGKALQKGGAKLGASIFGKVAAKAAGGGPLGVVTGVIGGLADVYGDFKKQEAVATGDMGALQTGRAASTVGTTLEYAGYGAMIGSIIPGIGTAVGAALGGVVGAIKGVWDNWFSDEAKEQERLVERTNANNDALKSLIKINESVDTTMAQTFKQTQNAIDLASNEEAWRAALLAQVVELTRISEQILFKGELDTVIVGGKEVKRGFEGSTDMTKAVKAQMLGKADALTDREANILKASQGNTNGLKNSKGEAMNFAEFKKNYGVTDDELARIREKQNLLDKAAVKQAELQAKAAQTPAAPGGTTVGATPAAPGATVKTVPAGTVAAPGGTAVAAAAPAGPSVMESILTTIQTQADTRGIIMAGKLDTANSILTQISNSLLASAGASSDKLFQKLVNINGNAEKTITRLDKIAIASNNVSLGINGTGTPSGKVNLNANTVELIKINKNLQALLDAMLQNNGNSGEIYLAIDGKQVSRTIRRRDSNLTGVNPSETE